MTAPVINGGTIDSAVIGGTTAAAGTFTTLNHKAGNSSTNIRAGGQLTPQISSVGTPASTVETTLQTVTLPANLLDADGRRARFRAYGSFGATANNKTIRFKAGATTIYNSGLLPNNGGSWMLEAELIRTGSNTQQWCVNLYAGSSIVGFGSPTSALTDSGTIAVTLTAENAVAAANDVVCKIMTADVVN